jgi:hypothetical protein
MPTELVAALAAAILGLSGATLKRFGDIEKRINQIELNVASNFISKEDFTSAQDRLFRILERFETKLDCHIYQEPTQSKGNQNHGENR